MRKLVLATALVLGLAASAAATPAPPPFQPAQLAGSWKGTWHNLTFGSTGPAFIRARAIGRGKKAKLNFLADFGGNVFGCSDPPSDGATLTRGVGANHWGPAGFVDQGHLEGLRQADADLQQPQEDDHRRRRQPGLQSGPDLEDQRQVRRQGLQRDGQHPLAGRLDGRQQDRAEEELGFPRGSGPVYAEPLTDHTRSRSFGRGFSACTDLAARWPHARSASPTARPSSSTGSRSPSRRPAGSASSARTGSASRPCCACWPGSRSRTPGAVTREPPGLSVAYLVQERAVDGLSGGEAARRNLEAILAADADVLLLDEPTNDLDFAGLELLERFLASHRGGVVAVSHDRAFLERMTSIVELEAETRRVRVYAGGWSEFVAQREAARERHESAYAGYVSERERLEEQARRMRQWEERGYGQGRKKKKSKDVKKAAAKKLGRLERVEKPWAPWQLRLSLAPAARGGDVVARLSGARSSNAAASASARSTSSCATATGSRCSAATAPARRRC